MTNKSEAVTLPDGYTEEYFMTPDNIYNIIGIGMITAVTVGAFFIVEEIVGEWRIRRRTRQRVQQMTDRKQ